MVQKTGKFLISYFNGSKRSKTHNNVSDRLVWNWNIARISVRCWRIFENLPCMVRGVISYVMGYEKTKRYNIVIDQSIIWLSDLLFFFFNNCVYAYISAKNPNSSEFEGCYCCCKFTNEVVGTFIFLCTHSFRHFRWRLYPLNCHI